MQIFTLSSHEFQQHTAAAQKVASGGDVVYVLDKGQPAHVFMGIEKFRELSERRGSIVDLLAMPEAAEIDFEVERGHDFPRSVDLF